MTDVGHRALLAYERDRDRYDLHYAHWGAHDWHLVETITPDQPFGAPERDRRQQPTAVDPAPLATDCSFESIRDDHLDYQQYEAVYLVSESHEVQPWLVCWFGCPSVDISRPGDGGIVTVDPEDARTDGERLRGWFAGSKETVCALVDRGVLAPTAARSYLATIVRSLGGDGRTVHLGPAARRSAEE